MLYLPGVNQTDLLFLLAALGAAAYFTSAQVLSFTAWASSRQRPGMKTASLHDLSSAGLTPVAASFNIDSEPPEQYRPFKPIYKMTMALQSCDANDQIKLDMQYRKKIQTRREAMLEDTSNCIGTLPEGVEPLREVYRYLLHEFLPKRYPQHFSLDNLKRTFYNDVLHESHPMHPPDDIERLQTILCTTVEDDLLITAAEKDPQSPDYGKYRQVAFVAGFPAGFSPLAKQGMILKDIHKPVPMYKEKLEASMDRYFSKVKVGDYVKRFNWSVSTTGKLFMTTGHHLVEEEDEAKPRLTPEEASRCSLRVERQVLRRLPETQALLLSVKTMMYPLSDIRAEGSGPALATAIEGLPNRLAHYKARPQWGESVKEYLRS